MAHDIYAPYFIVIKNIFLIKSRKNKSYRFVAISHVKKAIFYILPQLYFINFPYCSMAESSASGIYGTTLWLNGEL